MEAITAFLQGKALWLAVGFGSALALKFGPKILAAQVFRLGGKALSTQDPADRDLALAVIRWVEVKLPDRGMGQERWKLAAAKLVELFPILAGQKDRLAALIEESVARMDEELKKLSGGQA